MRKVLIYSGLLIIGLVLSQMPALMGNTLSIGDLDLSARQIVQGITMLCMSYIMLEVGLEFTLNKKNLGSYGRDFVVASTAAIFPWLLCGAYFFTFFQDTLTESAVLGGFAAPTSAGLLFTMLAAAKMSGTWVFKKARVLAIFDDVVTILLMIPIQMILTGFNYRMFVVLGILAVLLFAAYRLLDVWKVKLTPKNILTYGFIVWIFDLLLTVKYDIHVGVLLPAFCLGCVIDARKHRESGHEAEAVKGFDLDNFIKCLFMVGVGLSLPLMELGDVGISTLVYHVLILTIISNIGKCFIIFCYKKEHVWQERLALSVAMFPRGEVGAGILLLALSNGNTSVTTSLAGISLGLNLLLTGVFIMCVKSLINLAHNAESKSDA